MVRLLGLGCLWAAATAAFAAEPAAPTYGPARLIREGYTKADTPAWLAGRGRLVFTDLESGKLWELTPPDAVAEAEPGGRGKAGGDGRWHGVVEGALVARDEKGVAETILPRPASGEISLNDLAWSPSGYLYFTTLKDPEFGRVTAVNLKDKTTRVLWEGTDEPTLRNPNGIAVSEDGKHLFVGISSYKERKHSAIYRFPIRDDGSLDLAVGKAAPWGKVSAPDGLALDAAGRMYATAGGKVVILAPEGKRLGELKIPKGSGTNLCFGGPAGKTLYVTTFNALYAFDPLAP